MALNQLTDDELAAFNNFLGWESGDAKKMCEDKPWFSKVEALFTEDGGKNIHSAVRDVIDKEVIKRLTEKGA